MIHPTHIYIPASLLLICVSVTVNVFVNKLFEIYSYCIPYTKMIKSMFSLYHSFIKKETKITPCIILIRNKFRSNRMLQKK